MILFSLGGCSTSKIGGSESPVAPGGEILSPTCKAEMACKLEKPRQGDL